MGLILVQLLHY